MKTNVLIYGLMTLAAFFNLPARSALHETISTSRILLFVMKTA